MRPLVPTDHLRMVVLKAFCRLHLKRGCAANGQFQAVRSSPRVRVHHYAYPYNSATFYSAESSDLLPRSRRLERPRHDDWRCVVLEYLPLKRIRVGCCPSKVSHFLGPVSRSNLYPVPLVSVRSGVVHSGTAPPIYHLIDNRKDSMYKGAFATFEA